jgi:drug/metabolite transporter (DMT)-like permease
MELDEIRNLWKKQNMSGLEPHGSNNNGILSTLAELEKKIKRKYIIATCALVLESLFFFYLIFYQDFFSGISFAGVLLIIAALAMAIPSIWSTHILFNENELVNPGADFLKKIMEKLDRRKYLRIYLIPAYLVMIAFGITMIFSQHLAAAELKWKILAYSASYLYILLIYIITAYREKKKEKTVTEPIKEKIASLIYQMESGK